MKLRILAALIIVLVLSLVLWKIPEEMAKTAPGYESVKSEDVPKLVDDYRKTLAQIVGGLILLGGLFFTWRTWQLNREGQVTERFTRAIDQLGAADEKNDKPKLEIRLGGIYALERIAKDSKRDHAQIMEVLTAYLRDNYPYPTSVAPDKNRSDLDAILSVLRRRTRVYGRGEDNRLDLRRTNLAEANLAKVNLQGAYLVSSNLEGADLTGADLKNADLTVAKLQNAYLRGANLWGAKLDEADLRYADLKDIKNWKKIESMNLAQVSESTNTPGGFDDWATTKGAIVEPISDEEWRRRKAQARGAE